jgi:hypothetical protein
MSQLVILLEWHLDDAEELETIKLVAILIRLCRIMKMLKKSLYVVELIYIKKWQGVCELRDNEHGNEVVFRSEILNGR